MKQQSYLKNAAILTATGLFLRAAGMLFRIYLAAKIGAEGMGLYQLIYTVYTLAVTFATAGVSILATRLATDMLTTSVNATKPVMRKILLLGTALGFAAAISLFFLAKPASLYWLCDARAILPLKVLAPSLPFMAVSAALRGYFMARRSVMPNAKAQILEQLIRISLVAALIGYAAPFGIEYACSAVVLGNTVSEISSWIYMMLAYKKDAVLLPNSGKAPRLGLFHILAPVAASQYLSSILRTIENVMVPGCLAQFTHNREAALAQYGALKGMAMPVMFFPFSVLTTLSTLLLPEITRAHVKKENKTMEYLIGRVMLITCILSAIAAGIFVMFSREIGLLLYKSEEIGFYICVLGPLMPIMYLESMVDGILKGLDEQLATFKYGVADSVMRILLILALLPRFGMKGFLFVMLLSNLLTGILNVRRLFVVTKIKFDYLRWIAKPCLSLLLCAVAKQFVLYPFLKNQVSLLVWTILGVLFVGSIYMLSLWLMGGFSRRDFLPKSFNKSHQKQAFAKK